MGLRFVFKTVAGAEGFEPSALGFGDRCSDQTELRPYCAYGILPNALRAFVSIEPWPCFSPTWVSTRATPRVHRSSPTQPSGWFQSRSNTPGERRCCIYAIFRI